MASHLDTFNKIFLNADNIIKNNGYEAIDFYGVLFCYFCYYDKMNFPQIIKKFSEGNADILYEILITYHSYFKNILNQESLFYNNFIRYVINQGKEIKILDLIYF